MVWLAVVFALFLLVVSPGFRGLCGLLFVLGLVGVGLLLAYNEYVTVPAQKRAREVSARVETERRAQERAEEFLLASAVPVDQIELTNADIRYIDQGYGGRGIPQPATGKAYHDTFTLIGRVRNVSEKYDVSEVQFTVRVKECQQECIVIGEASPKLSQRIPHGQARDLNLQLYFGHTLVFRGKIVPEVEVTRVRALLPAGASTVAGER